MSDPTHRTVEHFLVDRDARWEGARRDYDRAVFDLLIAGALVIDGTGAPPVRADVGIRDDTIAAVGDLEREPAGLTLEAAGRVVAPGFIDMHSHSPCLGWLERQRAWGEAFSDRDRFTVDREPADGRPCRYAVRRQPRGGV